MKTQQILAVTFACLAFACEGVETEEASLSSSSEPLLGNVDCANVINFAAGGAGTFALARIGYVHEYHLGMAYTTINNSSGNLLDVTAPANYSGHGSVAADRMNFKVSRVMTSIGGRPVFLGSSARVRFFKSSNNATALDISMTPTDCSVDGNSATVAGIDSTGGHLVAKMFLCTVEGC